MTSVVWHTYSYFPCTDFYIIFILAMVNQLCWLAVCEINKASIESVSLPSLSSLGILTHTRHRQGSSELFFVLINGRSFTDVSPFENRDGWAICLSTLQFMTFSVRRVSLESVFLKCFTQLCISETGNISWLVDFKFPQFEFFLFITVGKLW